MAQTAPKAQQHHDDDTELNTAYGRLDHVLDRLEKSFVSLKQQTKQEPDLLSFADKATEKTANADAENDDQEVIDMLQQLLDEAEQTVKDLKAELADAHTRIARLEDSQATIMEKVDHSIGAIESVLEVEH